MVEEGQHRMALLVQNADYHSEACSPDCHVPTVEVKYGRRQSSEWLEKMGKATLSERAAAGLEG